MLITNLLLFLSQKKIIFYFFFCPYSTKSELWCDAIIIINYWVVKKGGVAVVLVVVVNGWLNFTPILMNWLGLLDNGCCFSQILKRSKSRLTQSFTHTALLQIYLITPSLSLSLSTQKFSRQMYFISTCRTTFFGPDLRPNNFLVTSSSPTTTTL